ncbi:MAG TPA: FtsK/SpoIIIE domain-containing protein [Phycisphaerales bacterium]|nr:FtsK/SpoIIIE domain-containing protein [Phycisphaerales bacterium]
MSRMVQTHAKPLPAPSLYERELVVLAALRARLAEQAGRSGEAVAGRDRAVAEADAAVARAREHAERDLQRRLSRAEAELGQTIAHIETQRDEKLRASKAAADIKQSAQAEHHERVVERAERESKESIWLAETVYESARPRPGQEFDALCKRLDAELRELAEAANSVEKLWPSGARRDAPGQPEPDAAGAERYPELLAGVLEQARTLERMRLAAFFRSGLPWLLGPLLVAGAAVGAGLATGWRGWEVPAAVAGGTTAILLALLLPLRALARRSFLDGLASFRARAGAARVAAGAVRARGQQARDEAAAALAGQCRAEVERARAAVNAAKRTADAEHAQRVTALAQAGAAEQHEIESRSAADRRGAESRAAEYIAQARRTHAAEIAAAEEAHRLALAEARAACEAVLGELRRAWIREAGELREEIQRIREAAAAMCPTWEQRLGGGWSSREHAPFATRLGSVRASVSMLGPADRIEPSLRELLPESIDLPLALDVAARGSLLVETRDGGRDEAIRLVQTVLLRLLASAPPGRAKLTIFDPVGRGRSFAGLMRLADFDESLVGSRIWTESRHMEQRLTDITEHIENVIQKYLRDDYATIDEYNRVAGEIAEPYRYLVVADFPVNFTEDAAARLASIIDAGARCGVFVVMLVDPAAKLPPGVDLRELRARAVVVEARKEGGFRVADPAMRDLTFEPDPPPTETQALELLGRVGEQAVAAGRVEVSYAVVEPREGQLWTRSCAEELRVPIGRAGATKAQELRLGRGTSQHVLVAGKTGSGKSTLLHVLATSAMLWHAPSEVEFYLVDFKKGVEFKPYASGDLPHVRAVAIESDREFGLSVLQKLDVELRRRGDLFRERGVQSLSQFRERFPDESMPRSILMIDEFQEFFVEDDRIAQDASLLLDRLVRQGRAFGIHVLLASQTLSGAYTLARSTVGQMAVRIALKCSETDSYLILSEDNGAARLLSRPGEAIYNDANGLVEGNNPFQVAWLDDDERQGVLDRVATLARRHRLRFEEPVFFEGNAAADLSRNRQLRRAGAERARPIAPVAWLGEPVSIKEPTGAVLRRRGGANVLIVGQRSETAGAILASAVLSLAAQHEFDGPRAATFLVVDGTPEDDPFSGRLGAALAPLPHQVRAISWRDAPAGVAEAHAAMAEREGANRTDGPAIYLVLHGLHWLRSLRRRDDDISFSFDREEKGPAPDQQLKQLLVDGPRLGVFVLAWCDTVGSLTRALDRSSIAEFGNRVLMQMSANDSSMLIESTSAARLGLHRAIFFDEERGAEEKFRPYGLPDVGFVRELAGEMRPGTPG